MVPLPRLPLAPLSSPLLIRMEPTSVMSRTGGWVASVCPLVPLPITHASPVPSWCAPAGPPAAAGSARRRSARRGPDRPKKKESERGAVSDPKATAGGAEFSTDRVSIEGTQLRHVFALSWAYQLPGTSYHLPESAPARMRR